MPTALEVSPDGTALASRAAAVVSRKVNAAIAERGRCALALSGGSSVGAFFNRLAGSSAPWDAVSLYQVDERAAPKRHDERNLTLLTGELLDRIEGPAPELHEMAVDVEPLQLGAERYAALLEEHCGAPPVLDVVHLGIGADGHTASLVPGDPVLDVRDRWVATTGVYGGWRRMTLTFPVLDAARSVVFVVQGAEKKGVLSRVLEGDESLPAVRVRAREILVLASRESV